MTWVNAFRGKSSDTLLPHFTSNAAAILASGVILLRAVIFQSRRFTIGVTYCQVGHQDPKAPRHFLAVVVELVAGRQSRVIQPWLSDLEVSYRGFLAFKESNLWYLKISAAVS